jgi:hypothetical protein
MPSITVEVEGEPIATVACAEYHVVAVRIGGTRVEEEFATLALTASTHPENEESTYLTWISDLVLQPGQQVTVRFSEYGDTSHPGKTIDELYPGEEPTDEQGPKSIAECFQELRARANLRTGYSFSVTTPQQPSYSGRTEAAEYSFSFHVLWNWLRPNRASVSLTSFTIDSIEHRTPSREHVDEYIAAGQAATVRVDA